MTSRLSCTGVILLLLLGCADIRRNSGSAKHETSSRIVKCTMYVGTADLIVLETELARIEIGKPILISHLKADRQRFYQLGGPDDSTAMKYTKCIAAIESQKTRSFAHLTPGIARRAERYVGICLEEGVAQVFNRLKGQYEPDIEVRGFWWRGVGSLDGGSGIRYYIRGAGRPFFSRVVVIA